MNNIGNKVPLPETIKICPSLICNLRCPLCPTGLGGMNYNIKLMTQETFSIILRKLPHTIKCVSLFNHGEPFMNPDLFYMITALKSADLTVDIHTNFSFQWNDNFFEQLVTSGLDTLIISLDGASAKSYFCYRQGGNFDLVVHNLHQLLLMRNQRAATSPNIIWKFLVNRYNESEIKQARQMAQSLGIGFITDFMGLGEDMVDYQIPTALEELKQIWLPQNKLYLKSYYQRSGQQPFSDKGCSQLFLRPVIKPDGKVAPCCWITDADNTFGDLLKNSFENIWYNDVYTYSRSLFIEELNAPVCRTICASCRNFTGKASVSYQAIPKQNQNSGEANPTL